MTADLHDDWRATATPSTLGRRSELLWRVRSFFHDRGFIEVHTPTISSDTVVDRFLYPIRVSGNELQLPATRCSDYFLQTSPEFCMKRLVASGLEAIYQIGPAYRAAERGRLHNPEFTMLEWYRVGDNMAAGIALLSELVSSVLGCASAEVVTYQDAFQLHANLDPLNCTASDCANRLRQVDEQVADSNLDDLDEWLDLILTHIVQPKLGVERPTVLTNYPCTQSALARASAKLPRTAERFELFIDGVELANGYNELIDADELEARNIKVNAQRRTDQSSELPMESRLLAAMRAGMPPCSGTALGIDRLVMLETGCSSIDEVICFPIDRA